MTGDTVMNFDELNSTEEINIFLRKFNFSILFQCIR